MKYIGGFWTVLSVCVCLCGCTEKDESSQALKRTSADAEVLMRVDDEVLTSKDLEGQVALRVKIMRQKYAKNSEALGKIKEYEMKLRETAAQAFVQKAVFVKYAKAHQVTISEDEFAAYLNKSASFYGYGTVEAVRQAYTADEYACFEKTARFELMAEMGEKAFDDSIVVSVSDQEIDEGFKKLERINATAQATNVLVFARATNVYEQIRSGKLTFLDAVKQYSEDGALIKNGLWGTLKCSDIKAREPALDALLKNAKQDDILPPIECDNAAAIIKVGPSINETVALSRVLFKLAAEWEIPTREKLREVLEYNKFVQAKDEQGQKLLKACKIWGRDDALEKTEAEKKQ